MVADCLQCFVGGFEVEVTDLSRQFIAALAEGCA
jgi:hypothetical protein